MKFVSLFLFALVLCGCQTPHLDPVGPYHGDLLLYNSDDASVTAYGILDKFLEYERAHESTVSPQVHAFAEKVRKTAPKLFKDLGAARKVYLADPTPVNRGSIDSLLKDVRILLAGAAEYLLPIP